MPMPLVSPYVWSPRGYSDTAVDEIKAASNKVTGGVARAEADQAENKALAVPTTDYSDFFFPDDFLCDMMMCFPIVDTTTDHKKEPLSRAALRKYSIDSHYSYSTTNHFWDETLERQHQQHGALQVH